MQVVSCCYGMKLNFVTYHGEEYKNKQPPSPKNHVKIFIIYFALRLLCSKTHNTEQFDSFKNENKKQTNKNKTK